MRGAVAPSWLKSKEIENPPAWVAKWLYNRHIRSYGSSRFRLPLDNGNRDKCQKHGVSIAVIESMFLQAVAVFPDHAHSEREERFKAIGRADGGRFVLIVFTLRKRGASTFIRPLSAR